MAARARAPKSAAGKARARTQTKAAAAAPKKTAATRTKAPRAAAATAPLPRAIAPKATASPRARAKKPNHEELLATYEILCRAHPDAHCELDHRGPFELIVATVLSAQSTDVAVNKVTPELFRHFPTPAKLAAADQLEVEATINKIGMYRQKAKNLIGLARGLLERHDGQVPRTLPELVELPGVGRKTANVVLGVAFGTPEGVVVDTHVQRITQRLGWTKETTPEKIEKDLMAALPRSEWDRVSHTLIFHGRRICTARKPSCSTCPVNTRCPSAFHAEDVGRKPPRVRAR